uniref:Uncharacterized protein n=1 Tax=Arundo donax TaxID=35708 RepID=A0A0A9B600_ARUDO
MSGWYSSRVSMVPGALTAGLLPKVR